jgi:hypothetical protein
MGFFLALQVRKPAKEKKTFGQWGGEGPGGGQVDRPSRGTHLFCLTTDDRSVDTLLEQAFGTHCLNRHLYHPSNL